MGRKKAEGVEFYERKLKYRIQRHWKYFKIYCVFSLSCAVLLFFVLVIMTSVLSLHYLISLFIAYFFAMSINFILNKKYTFNHFIPKKTYQQYYQFLIIGVSGFLANSVLLYFFVEKIGVSYWISEIIIGFFGIPILYIIQKYWTFNF
jgi:putative flippase GtrA